MSSKCYQLMFVDLSLVQPAVVNGTSTSPDCPPVCLGPSVALHLIPQLIQMLSQHSATQAGINMHQHRQDR